MFELVQTTEVSVGDEITAMRHVREAVCNLSAALPVAEYPVLHKQCGQFSAMLSQYIDALARVDGSPQ